MEQEPKNVTVLDGKDATIMCRAVGAPTPNITWTFNSKLITLYFVLNVSACIGNYYQFTYIHMVRYTVKRIRI